MVSQQFLDFYAKINGVNQVGLEDWSDRLNLATVTLFGLAAVVVGIKQYIMNDISCYIPVSPSGEKFKEFLNDYCWVRGTIPLARGEALPDSDAVWDEYDKYRRITYYQWVPFVLGLQCILFYIPHIAWQAVCAHRSGGDLFALVKSAADAATSERGAREKQVKRVAEFLEDMIDGQRDCHKQTARRRLAHRAYEMCGLCVVSKRLGTCLVVSYLGVKILTIINAILQVYLIQRFLGFYADGSAGQKSLELGKTYESDGAVVVVPNGNENVYGFGFGLTVANHIRQGRDWPETMLFPRVAYCRVPGIRLVGVENTYTAQCALPINMLNEKIYIFFWFWIMFLICACVLSLVMWLIRMVIAPRRKDFIKRFLRIKGVVSRRGVEITRSDLDDFIDSYLRRDGVFLIRMLALNAGEVITAEIVTVLYNDYIKHLEEHEGSSSVDDEKAALARKENPPSYV